MGAIIIDRIIPIWRDDWNPIGAARDKIKVHDVVTWKGSTWICVQEHTADNDPAFGTEPGGIYTKYLWLKLAGGLDCLTGGWNNSTLYYVGNCVIHGAASWICRIKHTNEVPNEAPDFWFPASKAAIYWAGIFDATQNYVEGSVVLYQNSLYYTLSNTSGFQPTFGDGLNDFQMLVQGIYGSGNYQYLSTYTTGELVRVRGETAAPKFGGSLWVQRTRAGAGSAQTPHNDPSWINLAAGLDFADAPSNTTRYYKGDVLKYGDDIWVANQDCLLGDNPAIDPTKFARMVDQTMLDKIVEYDTSNLPNRLRVRFKRADSFMPANQPDWWQLYGYPNPLTTTAGTGNITTGTGLDPGGTDPELPPKDPNATGSVLFPEGETTVDMLLIGGGGAGADPDLIHIDDNGTPTHIWRGCGGGGAGGALSIENYPLNGKYKVQIGQGATHWDKVGGITKLIDKDENTIYKATGGGSGGHTGSSSGGEKAYPFPRPDGEGEIGQWWAQYTCEPIAPEAGFRGGRGDTSGFTGGGGGGGGAGGPGGDATVEAGGAAGKPVKWLDDKEYAAGGPGCRQIRFEGVQTSTNPWVRYGQAYDDAPGNGGKGAMIVEADWSMKKTVAAVKGDKLDDDAGRQFWGMAGVFVMRFKTGACDITDGALKAVKTTDTAGNTYYYFGEDDEFEIRANVDPDPNATENTGVANFGAGDIDILLVGAGGYGGNRSLFYPQPLADYPVGGAGGGAGGYVSIEQVALSDGTYQVFVGGSAGWDGTRNMTNSTNPLQGGHTILRDSTGIIGIAYGGGYPAYVGHQGSSAGKISHHQDTVRAQYQTIEEPTGTSTGPMFGHRGGSSADPGGYSGWANDAGGGGGGGAGGPGGDAISGTQGGDAGAPKTWMDGKDYAAGGAGLDGNGTYGQQYPDAPGNGGHGSTPHSSSSSTPAPAQDGIFIIRYQTGAYSMATGQGQQPEDRTDGYSYLEMTEADTLIISRLLP